MTTAETLLRQQIAASGRSLFSRGLTSGSSGNISVRLDNGWLMTPTNCCLGTLVPEEISKLDDDGNLLSGKSPSKELFLHRAFLLNRPDDKAVIHIHSSHAVAVSCLEGLDPADVLPAITPYATMRFGRVALIPYAKPGDYLLAENIGRLAPRYSAVLLANHGPIVSGASLEKALFAMEELEETAKLFLILRGMNYRKLTPSQVRELQQASGGGPTCL